MRKGLFLFVILIGVFVYAILTLAGNETPLSIESRINENLHDVLTVQQQDMDDFETDFAVYTNPFAIQHNTKITKRVFVNGGLVFWSNNKFHPEYSVLKQSDTLYTVRDQFGTWLVKRRQVVADHDLIEIFSLINLSQTPTISNQYLQDDLNPKIFESYDLRISDRGEQVASFREKELFRMTIPAQSTVQRELTGVLIIILFAAYLVFLLVKFVSKEDFMRKNHYLIIVLLLLLRAVLYFYTQSQVTRWDLFNSVYFTSGWLNPTLGDLLFNGLLVFVVLVLLYRRYSMNLDGMGTFTGKSAFVRLIAMLVANLLVFYWVFQATWSIVEHSQLELDITRSILFDDLRVAAYAYLILVALSALIVFSFSQRLSLHLEVRKVHHYLASVLLYILLSSILGGNAWVYFGAFSALWILSDYWRINKAIESLRYQSFIFLVMVYATVGLIMSFAIYRHYEKDDLVAKQKFANRLLIRNDILGEFYLSQIMDQIAADRYIRTRLMSKILARQNIREKVKRQFLSSYFKKYDIDVYLFDADGNSLQSDLSRRAYSDWKEQYQKAEYKTDYQGIFFLEDLSENIRNKYVCFIGIEAYGRNVGYIILDLTLKKNIPVSVFPELLLESKYYVGSKEEFDYAVFKNGEILYKQGRYNFENKLTSEAFHQDELYNKGVETGVDHFFGLKTYDGRIILIVSPRYTPQAGLANFSFIFLLLVFVSGLVLTLMRLFLPGVTFNLSTKIQLYLGLSFLIPMLIVSVALINTLNISYKEEIDRNFEQRSFNIAENIIDYTEAYFNNQINVDEYANEIVETASIAQSDLNIYNASGKLVTTSQPEIYRQGLLYNMVHAGAYYKIKYKKEQNIIAGESIGKLDFKTSFTALRSYKDGRLLGFLAMPYFDSKNHLRQQQVEVFNSLIIIFTIIFLVSLVGGNMIVGQLVKPLKKIGDKLRRTSLQEDNQPILYEAQDEIGSLVKEYNAMLVKLEESKEALAASQKESAWKEIARQVAHEIKNPLTPMRLKIQQMMRSFEHDSKPYKTCETLITQVDSLSSIADSFSEFAKMPAPNNEKVEVVALVNKTINLYQSADVKLTRQIQVKEAFAYVDPKIFGRIMTNVVLNAIQSHADENNKHVKIAVSVGSGKILIAITDKGQGIPEDQKDKIFTPYFSTKTKGSGIGLAVAKKGIENAGGNIWFESEEGKGTTFFISIPEYQG